MSVEAAGAWIADGRWNLELSLCYGGRVSLEQLGLIHQKFLYFHAREPAEHSRALTDHSRSEASAVELNQLSRGHFA